MKHIKDLGCGYDRYSCVGITSFPTLVQPDCASIYDNFYNLPTQFQSVTNAVTFLDLGSSTKDYKSCIQTYDPLKSGLFDAFKLFAGVGDIATYKCYEEDKIQRPGIILPAAEISPFAPVPLQAVPTVALGTVSVSNISTIAASQLVSVCGGFRIDAWRTQTNTIKVSVSSGKVFVQNGQDGSPVSVNVKGIKQLKLHGSTIQAIVYVYLSYDTSESKWKGELLITQGEIEVAAGTKSVTLGTVRYQHGAAAVIQTQCSPVDARFGDIARPKKGEDQSLYVMTTTATRLQKKWTGVKDCG